MNIKDTSIEEKKRKRQEQKIRKSRLIIRNLSFKATENDIRKVFSQFGNIVDINLPKKADGKPKGFAFISFDNIGSSLKAIKHVNGQEILKRAVAVDFSLPKNTYDEMQAKKEKETKSPNNEYKNDTGQDEDEEEEDRGDEEIDEDDQDDKESDNDDDMKMEDEEENDFDDEEDDDDDYKSTKKSRKPSDVVEGKTVFIRNLDLDTTEESLAELLSTFGPLEYCKICINKYTEKSRGTAFAKFKRKEDADKCLEEESIADNPKLYIDGQRISVTLAVPQNKLIEIENAKHNKHKDKRNLYLAKEGLIYPNSPAAVGVSQSDLKKRLQLEEHKRKALQNYHNFISDRRLCIHNLPPNYDDKKLRQLFVRAVNDKNAKILWVKVMRNMNKTERKLGKSKGFGFVEFAEHSHALKALRFLNNNPDIFTPDKRPIVEFSVENKVALNRKKYRLIKQQKLKEAAATATTDDASGQEQQHGARKGKKNKKKKKEKKIGSNDSNALTEATNEESEPAYSGVMTKPLEKDDKVVQPKLNRKIGQIKGELKQRNKQLKAEKKKRENSKRHLKKLKQKQEMLNNKRKRDAPEEDKFDSHYNKRKNVFLADADNRGNEQKVFVPHKKTKWFMQ